MDFSLYEPTIKFPTQPTRPLTTVRLATGTAQDYRAYADKLDQYEADMVEYNKKVAEYEAERAENYGKFKVDALKEVGLWGHEAGNRIFEYVWHKCDSRPEVFEELQKLKYVLFGPQ